MIDDRIELLIAWLHAERSPPTAAQPTSSFTDLVVVTVVSASSESVDSGFSLFAQKTERR